jgi:HK97 family phage prohead protease
MNNREVRFLQLMELRAEQNEQEYILEGYPIVFNQETDMGAWREVIDPAAVGDGKVLRDVALMVGHDFGMIPLAHSRRNNGSGTMTLTPDEHGVKMRASVDAAHNPKAMEAYSAVTRGDMSGMSFAFIVEGETWEDLDTDKPLRRITGFGEIYEVSLVAFPAYKGTSVSVQAASEGDALESVRASLESAKQKLEEERKAQAETERRTALLERLENLKKEGSEK